jgi:hypothetical protein
MRPVGRANNLATLMCQLSRNYGSLPPRALSYRPNLYRDCFNITFTNTLLQKFGAHIPIYTVLHPRKRESWTRQYPCLKVLNSIYSLSEINREVLTRGLVADFRKWFVGRMYWFLGCTSSYLVHRISLTFITAERLCFEVCVCACVCVCWGVCVCVVSR